MPSKPPIKISMLYLIRNIFLIFFADIPIAFNMPTSPDSETIRVISIKRMHTSDIIRTRILINKIIKIIIPSDRVFIILIKGPVIVGPFIGRFAFSYALLKELLSTFSSNRNSIRYSSLPKCFNRL